ncbi:hypothetical protein FRB90_000614 [Tulasnella sp. 427]|nr:hypothetical protein FRB90_000614 [Tulasnella sp. 427]
MSDSGITSYTDSSDAPFKADPPVQVPVGRDDSEYSNPPPYNTAGPSSPQPAGPFSARINHLYLSRQNDSVKGSYTVDVDLVVPAQLIPNVVQEDGADNLRLYSHNGNVAGDVVLIGRGDKRASLVAESKNGNVTLKLLSRTTCPFRLSANSHNGGVKVYIPRDFIGPLTSATDNGGLDLSDMVKRNHTPFSEDGKICKGFIGDWSSSGYGDVIQAGKEWKGDELVVGSKNGRVKVFYSDELNNTSGPSRGGFFGWFKSG